MLEGTRNTTRSTKQSIWSNWIDWCHERDLDPVSASVNSVLEYLAGLQAVNFSYSLINIHRSMLSSTLERSGNKPIGQLPYVKQLLKGVFNRNPHRPKYSSTWDVKVGASLLASWGPNNQLNLTQLSRKLTTLLVQLFSEFQGYALFSVSRCPFRTLASRLPSVDQGKLNTVVFCEQFLSANLATHFYARFNAWATTSL